MREEQSTFAYTVADYKVTVFDRSQYDENGYDPAADGVQAASVDHNKIVSRLTAVPEWY